MLPAVKNLKKTPYGAKIYHEMRSWKAKTHRCICQSIRAAARANEGQSQKRDVEF